jgi:branched-chain amino acid transport system ATP-binding protein
MKRFKRPGLATAPNASAGDLNYIDQKRLELARALAAEPELLLLDEWLAGLNPTELQEGIRLIESLSGSGITIIMVEHIMEAVRALCPRCAVMNAGRLIADGKTSAVLSDKAVIAAYLGDAEDA